MWKIEIVYPHGKSLLSPTIVTNKIAGSAADIYYSPHMTSSTYENTIIDEGYANWYGEWEDLLEIEPIQ